MTLAIIQAEVKNFTEWKKIFDADQPNIEKAGAKLLGVYTDPNNPNAVTMLYEASGPELYEKMMSDPHRQEDIKRAGVIGVPKASFFNKVG